LNNRQVQTKYKRLVLELDVYQNCGEGLI